MPPLTSVKKHRTEGLLPLCVRSEMRVETLIPLT